MSVGRLILHDDTSPVFFDSVTTPSWLQTEKIEKFFDAKRADLQKVTYLARNAKGIFIHADIYLSRTTLLCAIAALFAIIGGMGMAFCPPEYTKTRRTLICLSIASGLVSLVSAYILVQMHSKVSDYKFLFENYLPT